MSKVQIPDHLLSKLGPAMAMDVHWIDVKLSNGSVHPKMVVRGGRYITGNAKDKNGEGNVPFTTQEIKAIRRKKLFGWWPLW